MCIATHPTNVPVYGQTIACWWLDRVGWRRPTWVGKDQSNALLIKMVDSTISTGGSTTGAICASDRLDWTTIALKA